MDKFNEWLHTGRVENGLQIWCKIDTLEDIQYLKVQYRDNDGRVIGTTQDYPVEQIRILNNLIDRYRMETLYPHIDINNAQR